MKLIKLTTFYGGVEEPLYLNPNQIGHMYSYPAEKEYNGIKNQEITRIGITTHNNGGFEVLESVEQIIKLIEQ